MSTEDRLLPTTRAASLETRREERRWLVEGLWSERACGIVGGEPKCGKSFLALDLAVAVAAGTPVLGRFPVPNPGPVLLYAAEDDLVTVRERLDSITRARGASLHTLNLHVITAPSVRLDHDADRKRLARTVASLAPRLLVLDPLVRLHRIDENAVSEIAPILAYLRTIERKLGTAVLLVHHSRKAAGHVRAGQALRGSSELHAWGDSNLYLRRRRGTLCLGVEHRAAPAPEDLMLEIDPTPERTALRICPAPPANDTEPHHLDPRQRIVSVLRGCAQPVSLRRLRELCRIRTSTLCRILEEMVRDGTVIRLPAGFTLA